MVGGDNSGCTDSYRIRKTGNSLNGISGFLIYDGTDGYRCFFQRPDGKGMMVCCLSAELLRRRICKKRARKPLSSTAGRCGGRKRQRVCFAGTQKRRQVRGGGTGSWEMDEQTGFRRFSFFFLYAILYLSEVGQFRLHLADITKEESPCHTRRYTENIVRMSFPAW